MPAVIELEHFGVPFSRTEAGTIYQRPFGGHTTAYGEGRWQSALAPRRTAPAMRSSTRSTSNASNTMPVLRRYFALDLIMMRCACRGVMAWDLADGTLHRFRAHLVVLATGGYGRAYFSATSAHTCTGDGNAMILRAGLPLQDWSSCNSTRPAFTGRLPHHEGRAARGVSHQLAGRALHGALCTPRQGSRLARRRQPLDDDRDPRGARLRPQKDHILLHLEHSRPAAAA